MNPSQTCQAAAIKSEPKEYFVNHRLSNGKVFKTSHEFFFVSDQLTKVGFFFRSFMPEHWQQLTKSEHHMYTMHMSAMQYMMQFGFPGPRDGMNRLNRDWQLIHIRSQLPFHYKMLMLVSHVIDLISSINVKGLIMAESAASFIKGVNIYFAVKK